MQVTSKAGIGLVQVAIAPAGKGHPVEFWTERCMAKIMSVADTAPQPIRDQAYAFRSQIEGVIRFYINEAIKSDRATRIGA
jgi:hypothetical protein